jgi:hypothetical protein
MLNTAQTYTQTLAKLPPVPSRTCVYKSTQTTTTDENTTTWTGIDIGTPHPKRVVILAVYHGVAASCTATVNSIPSYFRAQNTAHEVSIHCVQVPNGTTADIAVTAVSSLRKACSIYVFYPENHLPIDSGTATANTTTNANVADQKLVNGGCLVYVGAQHATLGTFTTTWNGTDTLSEDVDAQLEAAASYTMGKIAQAIISSDVNDVDLAESASGTKRLAVVTLGPPPLRTN